MLRDVEDVDNDRQAERILARINNAVGDEMDSKVERDLRITVYGWLAFTFEMCRQRLIDPSIDADNVADACAHALLDAVGRVPGIPAAWSAPSRSRASAEICRCAAARWLDEHLPSPGSAS